MDTRSKIISREEAREKMQHSACRWVSGHFDPLLAEHVRYLRDQAAPDQLLIVEVTNPARPLLAQPARAELVAALQIVDHVVLANGIARAADELITDRFVEQVIGRHQVD